MVVKEVWINTICSISYLLKWADRLSRMKFSTSLQWWIPLGLSPPISVCPADLNPKWPLTSRPSYSCCRNKPLWSPQPTAWSPQEQSIRDRFSTWWQPVTRERPSRQIEVSVLPHKWVQIVYNQECECVLRECASQSTFWNRLNLNHLGAVKNADSHST